MKIPTPFAKKSLCLEQLARERKDAEARVRTPQQIASLEAAHKAAAALQREHRENPSDQIDRHAHQARSIALCEATDAALLALETAKREDGDARRELRRIDALLGASDAEAKARGELVRIDSEIERTLAERARAVTAIASISEDIEAESARAKHAATQAAEAALDRRMSGETVEAPAAPAEDRKLAALSAMLRAARQRHARANAALADLQARAGEVRASWRQARMLLAEIAFEEARFALGPFVAELIAARQLAGQRATTKLELTADAAEVDRLVRSIEAEVPPVRIVAPDPATENDVDDGRMSTQARASA